MRRAWRCAFAFYAFWNVYWLIWSLIGLGWPRAVDRTLKSSYCWSLCTLYLHVYLVFTCMPGESYCRQCWSLLCLCDVFGVLINSLVGWLHEHSGPHSVSDQLQGDLIVVQKQTCCLVKRWLYQDAIRSYCLVSIQLQQECLVMPSSLITQSRQS